MHRLALLAAGCTLVVAACGSGAGTAGTGAAETSDAPAAPASGPATPPLDDVRSVFLSGIASDPSLGDGERACLTALADTYGDDELTELLDALSASTPDLDDPLVKRFTAAAQGCRGVGGSLVDQLKAKTNRAFSDAATACIDEFLATQTESELQALIGSENPFSEGRLSECGDL